LKYPGIYEDRLVAWHDLRCSTLPDQDFLLEVNDFWQFAPEVKPTFDWREPQNWPDPWDLIREDDQSDLARGLGIVYTIILSGRNNLVEAAEIVNINLQQLSVIRSIPAVDLVSKIR